MLKVFDIKPDILNHIEYLQYYQEELMYIKWLRDIHKAIIKLINKNNLK